MQGTAEMVILITCMAEIYKDGYPTGRQELVVSHGIDEATGRSITVSCEHPQSLGGVFDSQRGEWVLK